MIRRKGVKKKRVMVTLPLRVFREFRAFAIGRGLSQAGAGELIIGVYMQKGLEPFLEYLADKQKHKGGSDEQRASDTGNRGDRNKVVA